MKSILLIFLAMTFCSRSETANEKFVSICKVSNDVIRIDYLDSTHSIIDIEKDEKGDTLMLKINVDLSKSHKSINVRLFEGVKYVSTGSVLYDINKIEPCKKVYSGEDALEELKRQKIE